MSEQETTLQDDEIQSESTESPGTEEGDSDGMDSAAAAAADPTRTARTAIPTAPTRSLSSALARCVAPVEAERFFGEYWERKPLLVPRDEEGRFHDLLTIAEVERRVTAGGLRHPAFRVVKEGATIRLGDYAEDIPWTPTSFSGTAEVERVAAQFERRRDDRPSGAPALPSSARGVLPRARARARSSRAGERVLHAVERAGLQGAPRHARRAVPPGRGREALARLRAPSRAAAEAPEVHRRDG